MWAHENTRESIFAARQRRETYATTGMRVTVRMFAGWDFEPGDENQPDNAAVGYARGVPMGGELNADGKGEARNAPRILVMAARDPYRANLERIQVVKGWRDREGKLHEKVYDAVLAPGIDADPAKSPSTVKGTRYDNSIGAPQLATVWRDPDFDSEVRAFYYVRVLEIPTPRWTAYDAENFDLELAPEIPTVTRERAYTSPDSGDCRLWNA